MSTEEDKFAHSKRLLKDENAIKKQSAIAKQHGVPAPAHAYAKRHAMTCGDSNCVMCGNPRKFTGELTQQEKRMEQDMDVQYTKRSNGASNDDSF